MPTYRYTCSECRAEKEHWHGVDESPEVLCDECGTNMAKSFGVNRVGSISKGITPAKAWKEKRVRAQLDARREVRKVERWGSGPKVAPNFNGQEVGSWEEAKKMAKDSGLDTSKYDSYVDREKSSKNSAGIDERKWKQAKDIARNS